MTIEIERERLDAAREKAVRKLAPKAKVPGFRPGKAPANMVRRYFGEERVTDEALDIVVPDAYREAMEADESIDAIARPRLVIETIDPLVVKATIPLRPTVELGEYQAVRIASEPVVVDESRVEETIAILRRRAATHEPVEREIGWRDIVTIDVRGTVEGEDLVEQQDIEIQLAEDRDVLFAGFEEELIGHRKGEEVAFDLPAPEDFQIERFRGKPARFIVQINETKEEVLPALDEEFAKAVGEGYETVDALRDHIREGIRKAEEDERDNRYHDQILGELVDRATVEFPPVMLDGEIDRLLHDQAGHIERGEDMQRYLSAIGKTEEEVRAELRPIADARLRRSLVLSKVSEAEQIAAAEDEIDAEIDKMTASAGPQTQRLRQIFSSEDGRDTIRRQLVTRKTLARLVEIATQEGVPAAATAEQEKPAMTGDKKKGEAAAEVAEQAADAPAETESA